MSFHPSSEAAIRAMQAAGRNVNSALKAVGGKDAVTDYRKLVMVLEKLGDAAKALKALNEAPRLERDQGCQKAEIEGLKNIFDAKKKKVEQNAEKDQQKVREDGEAKKKSISASSDEAGYRRFLGFVVRENGTLSGGRIFLAYSAGFILVAVLDIPASPFWLGFVVPLASWAAALVFGQMLRDQRSAVDTSIEDKVRDIQRMRDAELARLQVALAAEQRRIDADLNDRLKKLADDICSADSFLTNKAKEAKDAIFRWEKQYAASKQELASNGAGGALEPPQLLRIGTLTANVP